MGLYDDGTTTYYGDDDSGSFVPSSANSPGDGGVVNSSSPLTLPPDASGGNGSFLSALLPTLTNGVSATINSALISSLGNNSALYTVDAYGNLVPKAAAAANNANYLAQVAPAANPLATVFKSPTTLVILALVAGLLLYKAVK